MRFLVENGRMPAEADYPPGEADVRQATQPPLFFLVAAPIVAVIDDAQPVPPGVQPGLICIGGETANATEIGYPLTPDYVFPVSGAVLGGYALRLVNLIFGLVAVIFTYLAGRVLFREHPSIALLGAALLAFEPNIQQMVTTISNDAPLLAFAAANLYCAARLLERGLVRWRWLVPLMGTAVLAILTRLTGWAVFGFAMLVVLYAIGHALWEARKRARRGQLRMAFVGLALLVVAGIGIAAFNYSQSGTIFGRYRWLDDFVLNAVQNFNLPLATVVGVFDQTRGSYVAPLSALTPRNVLLTLYTLPVLLALAGALLGLILALVRRLRGQAESTFGAYLLLIVAVVVATALVLFRNTINVSALGGATLYNTASIFAPLRYYNAGLPPLALLLSAGLMVLVEPLHTWAGARRALPLQRLLRANPLAIGLAGLWFLVAVIGGVDMLRDRPAAQVFDFQTYQQMVGSLPETAGEGVEGYPTLYHHVVNFHPEDGLIDLTLYAGLNSPAAIIYAVEIDMMSEGQVLNRCQFLPAQGFAPTTLWQPETVVSFTSEIPNCAGALNTPVDLTLRWLSADMIGVIQGESPPIPLGTIDTPLAQASTCPNTLGIIAGGYRLTRFNSPPTVSTGETYIPSVNWIVSAPAPDVAGRAFVFRHVETGEQYTCAATDIAVQSWEHGEYIYFDRCPMSFPADAATGDYAVSVYIYNAAGAPLPATDAAGSPLPENAVQLGTIRVEE